MRDRRYYAIERSHRSWPVARWTKRARGHRVVGREAACFVVCDTARPAGELLTRDHRHDAEEAS